MKKLREIFSGVWKLYFIVLFAVILIILYPIYAIWLTKPKHFKKGLKLTKAHARLLMILTGVRVTVKNKHFIKDLPNAVFAPNHTSYMDILVLYLTIPHYFVFLGKQELQKVPVFNIFFKKMNIPVDRRNSNSGKIAMERCRKEIDNGNGVVLFPEGTIPKHTPKLIPFKKGAFKLAIDKQVPIVPITFLSNYKRLQMTSSLFKGMAGPGIAEVIIHEPIITKRMTEEDLLPLQKKVHEIIKSELENNGRKQ